MANQMSYVILLVSFKHGFVCLCVWVGIEQYPLNPMQYMTLYSWQRRTAKEEEAEVEKNNSSKYDNARTTLNYVKIQKHSSNVAHALR